MNDYIATLRYTSIFPDWTLHAGFSIAYVENTLLDRSPHELYYFFVGSSWHLSKSWDFLVQVLEYSSPFPEKATSTLGEDIKEGTMGLRWVIAQQFVWEIGFVENLDLGPHNIDIMFFSNAMFHF